MAMITTCPACHTRFRVSPEQMEAHGGDVRCGRCAKVFNAGIYLEQELEELQHEGQSKLLFDEPVAHATLTAAEVVPASSAYDIPAPAVASPSLPMGEEGADDSLYQPVIEAPSAEIAALSFDEVPAAEVMQPLPTVDEHWTEPVASVESFVPE